MNIAQLLNQLPGAVAQGLIWGIMAIGVYITFRILDIADLTLAEALDTFSRNRDVLEYRPLSWNPERDGLAGEDLEARNDMRNEEHER